MTFEEWYKEEFPGSFEKWFAGLSPVTTPVPPDTLKLIMKESFREGQRSIVDLLENHGDEIDHIAACGLKERLQNVL